MRRTGRSLSEPPGLRHSILARTSTSGSSPRRTSTRTIGVLPMALSAGKRSSIRTMRESHGTPCSLPPEASSGRGCNFGRPEVPCVAGLRNPHNFLLNLTVPQRLAQRDEAQTQVARFFMSDGVEMIDPDPDPPGRDFWEVPIDPAVPLPETLNFLPAAPAACVP